MTTQSKAPDTQSSNSNRLAAGRYLFVIVLVALMFLLGLTMVHHRFFRGGTITQHGVLKP